MSATSSVFSGLSESELGDVLRHARRARFASGETLIAQGDAPRSLVVIGDGLVDVIVRDRGEDHVVGRVSAGGVVGEMSLFTGQAASATVRAAVDVEAHVLDEAAFHRAAAAHPVIYRNLAAVLSEKLVATNERAIRRAAGRIGWLPSEGAASLLGWGLAGSVAWHARAPVLLLAIGAVDAELARAAPTPAGDLTVRVAEPRGEYAPEALAATVDDLAARYEHVLVQLPAALLPPEPRGRVLELGGSGAVRGEARLEAATTFSVRPDRERRLLVGELGPAAEELRNGALGVATEAGRSLGWAARRLAGLAVGVAFGAGGPRGYAHVGALRLLERERVPIDYVSGTSIGAFVAALVASGRGVDEISALLDDVGAGAWRFTISRRSMSSNAKIRAGLERAFGDERLEDYELPAALVAADVITSREVVFRSGLARAAVLASISIPGVYPPQQMDELTLVDGGVVNPVPADAVAALGADQILAVKLAKDESRTTADADAAPGRDGGPTAIQTILRAIEIMQTKIATPAAGASVTEIDVVFAGEELPGLRRFTDGRRFAEHGFRAAEEALPRLRAALPWLA